MQDTDNKIAPRPALISKPRVSLPERAGNAGGLAAHAFSLRAAAAGAVALALFAPASFAGSRSHFLSHGPSAAAFGRGETGTSHPGDCSYSFYNPSLLASLQGREAALSHFSLFDGSQYNFAGFCQPVRYGSFGVSVINLRSGDVEIRRQISDSPGKIQTNQWAYLLTWAGNLGILRGINYGLSLKYVQYDLYRYTGGGIGADVGLSQEMNGPVLYRTKTRLSWGVSVLNALPPEIELISHKELLGSLYRAGLTLTSPVIYRFQSIDTLSLSADAVGGDNELRAHAGAEYLALGRYVFRAGYYQGHVTSGAGFRGRNIRVDYAVDLSDFSTIHRLGFGYSWDTPASAPLEATGSPREGPALLKEAKRALRDRKKQLAGRKKITDGLFRSAKADYRKKRYLAATDKFRDLLLHYPDCASAQEYYDKISSEMSETVRQEFTGDLERASYARAYVEYYRRDFESALNEWQKVLQLNPERAELTDYVSAVRRYLSDESRRKREIEAENTVRDSFEKGEQDFNAGRWISCIRKMERAQKLCQTDPFPGALEWHGRTQAYIDRAVGELARTLKSRRSGPEEDPRNVPEYDSVGADRKYTEGLILYAQGKVGDAVNLWEIAARLDPGHEKAKKALRKAREELETSGKR